MMKPFGVVVCETYFRCRLVAVAGFDVFCSTGSDFHQDPHEIIFKIHIIPVNMPDLFRAIFLEKYFFEKLHIVTNYWIDIYCPAVEMSMRGQTPAYYSKEHKMKERI